MKTGEMLKLLLFESSIYVSLQSALYLVITSLFFHLAIDWILFSVIFLSTFFVYTINKYTDLEEDAINNPLRYRFFTKNKTMILSIASIAFLISLVTSFSYGPFIVLLTLVPFILGIVYSVKILPKGIFNKRRLKDVFLGKNLVVSFGWATRVFYVLPIVGFNIEIISLFLFVFMVELIANIAFDIRDVEGDKISGIKTLPVALGVERSLKTMSILNVIIILYASLIYIFNIMNIKIIVITAGIIVFNYTVINMISRKRHYMDKTFLYDFIIDSLTIILLIFVVISYMMGL